MKLNEDMINDVRNAAKISEVISKYIPIEKKGKNYVALCPFHDDHDPSLSISEDKQIYKCFVCGNGGNVFSFVMNYKNISFPEAVKEVADIIGKPLDIEIKKEPKKISKYQNLYDVLDASITYSNYLLLSTQKGEKAKEYLNNRGINEEIINYFNIGYNPEDNYLYKYLGSKGYKEDDLINCNIVRLTDYGINDVFYKRILFPIHDAYGNPVGFTARDFENLTDSKYINTSETPIYIKGNILYNYHRAKDKAKQLGACYLVEGVMDVIAYHKIGIDNVVASLGTACTTNQINLLSKLTKTIILSYDGDKAGMAANMHIGKLLLDAGFDVRVVDNKSGLDPDEIINKHGNSALRDLASKHLSYIDYAISYYKDIYNLSNFEDRKEFALKLWPIIDALKDDYAKDNYNNEVFELTNIRRKNNDKPNINNKKVYNSKVVSNIALDGLSKAEYNILLMMSQSLKATNIFRKELGCLLDETNQKLSTLIIDEYRKSNECHLSKIYDEVSDEKVKNLITTLATTEGLSEEFDETIMMGSIEKVKRQIKEEKLEELKRNISKVSNVDKEKTKEYLDEYSKLLKELGGKYGN